ALAIAVTAGDLTQQPHVVSLDATMQGALHALARKQDFDGKLDPTMELATLGSIKAQRLLLVGMGPSSELTNARVRATSAVAARWAQGAQAAKFALLLPDGSDVRAIAEGVGLGAYRFSKYLTGERKPKTELSQIVLLTKQRATPALKKQAKLGLAVADAVALARDSVNEPPNEL